MKIVFVSNYYNHHQQAFCHALHERYSGAFHFIATAQMRQDRRDLGYGGWDVPDYVRTAYTSDEDMRACRALIKDADVVIAGSAPEAMVFPALQAGKLVFLYRERPLKKDKISACHLMHFLKTRLNCGFARRAYLLCAGGYTAADYAKFGCFRGRAFKWGYYPETRRYEMNELRHRKNPASILWAGRLLDWKHPEQVIEVARRLKEADYDFTMDLIGIGPMESQLRQLIDEKGLADRVRLLGAMKPAEVRSHMERAGIFLFTSDRQEGWGAVLNESMNSGCAVVASHAIGSVPYLIEDGKNGLVYRSGDVDMLFEKVRILLEQPETQRKLGTNAYETIRNTWNAEVAARRLIELSETLLSGEQLDRLYDSGPCSPAELIDENWYCVK